MLNWTHKIAHVKDTPESIARGLAVGTFFAFAFLFGLQIILSLIVSHIVRGNKIVAATATAITNPFTYIPIYSFCYFVGHLIIGGRNGEMPSISHVRDLESFFALGPKFFITMLTGTTVVGIICSVIVYFSSEKMFEWLKRWHQRRKEEKR